MVLRPEQEKEAEAIFVKWGLDFAIVGATTDDLRFRVRHLGEEVANLPIKQLGDMAPQYDRPWIEPARPSPLSGPLPACDVAADLLALLATPDLSSRRWVFEQYDTLIQGNSLQLPGGDAGVIRVEGHKTKALAFSADVNPRYCKADPFEGGKQAVAECWRNLTAVGAEPIALTDNLNFGNPERPAIMGQLVACIRGLGEACRALDFPIVSGNVSLYNETNGEAIPPTPAVAGVGLLPDWSAMARIAFAGDDQCILLAGAPSAWGAHLGQSAWLRDLHGRREGPCPPVDLANEKRVGDLVRDLIRSGIATACHDCSDGGLAVALAEMAMASGIGANVAAPRDCPPAEVFFGEDQGRYVVTVGRDDLDRVLELAAAANVFMPFIGVTGSLQLKLGEADAISVAQLRTAHESWFPAFMEPAA